MRVDGTVSFQPSTRCMTKKHVLCPPTLGEYHHKLMEIYVVNTTTADVQLYKNTKVDDIISVESVPTTKIIALVQR